MKKYITLILIFLFTIPIISQDIEKNYFKDNGEVYFKFKIFNKAELDQITKIISIDNVVENVVYAYANEKEFIKFLELDYRYTVLPKPGKRIIPKMSSSIDEISDWDSYPTYDAYVDMMNQFASNYPEICQLVNAGTSVEGRDILFVKISDNINENENEPQFMYSSTMHGDETTGYVLMLRLIDSLLTTYGTDPGITELIDNVEIWINPLANPDGTYAGGNNTVYGATRYNANWVDLNRNFPDPDDGPHPDGNAWQPETQAMKFISGENHFILSANFHGGAEVVNYPWDTYSFEHPDDNWWEFISHLYADTAQVNSPSNYMSGFNDGIIRGYEWYPIAGGRQDYFTYYRHGREVTIEISDVKLLNASQLPAHWNYNKKSFLDYIRNSLHGIRGIVTDTVGNPLNAKIEIEAHDELNSWVETDPEIGNYHRMIEPGIYTLTFSANEHYPKTIPGVMVQELSTTILNVELDPEVPVPVELLSFNANIYDGKVNLKWSTATELNNKGFEIQRASSKTTPRQGDNWATIGYVEGKNTTSEEQTYSFVDENISAGKYQYRLKQIDYDGSYEFSTIVDVELSTPAEYELSQNYPNPFNPNTTIKFSIPETGLVKLKVFNLLGEEVATLINEIKESGNYQINYSAKDLNSGIYFYKLETEKFSKTMKMLLMK